ncbi:unnamed protein product [Trifolium pratense]|uniref:Uncharacterized protein n=1 Tax=Trifolium pratense TaxID=57577 RepID=A0ACB0LLD1_TRIPR|nr:unnamed protein product [Trifolium pratense]
MSILTCSVELFGVSSLFCLIQENVKTKHPQLLTNKGFTTQRQIGIDTTMKNLKFSHWQRINTRLWDLDYLEG